MRSVGSLEVSEDVASRSLGLPFFRGITETQVMRIQSAIRKVSAPRGERSVRVAESK